MKSIIIYATKHGCAEKTAKMLASMMEGQTTLVNIMKENVPSLDEYDNVILGGSIYMGKIHKELSGYVATNLPVVLKKRTGLFICAGSPDPAARVKELETAFPAELYSHSISKELFGYEIIYEKLGFLEKMIMKAVSGSKNSSSELQESNIARMAKVMSSI